MKKALEYALKTGELTALYTNKTDTEVFAVGIVVSLGKTDILCVTFDSNSETEGFCFFNIDAIYRIEQGSLYLNDMEKKIKKHLRLPKFEKSPWDSFLVQTQDACDNHIVCNLKTGELKRGVLVNYSQKMLTIQLEKSESKSGGLLCIDRSQIIMMSNRYKCM